MDQLAFRKNCVIAWSEIGYPWATLVSYTLHAAVDRQESGYLLIIGLSRWSCSIGSPLRSSSWTPR